MRRGARLRAGVDPVGRAGLREHPRRPARLHPPLLPACTGAAVTVDVPADFDRARVLAIMGRVPEAVALLESVLDVDPAHRGALLLRASLHGEERAREKSLELSQRAARAWQGPADAL